MWWSTTNVSWMMPLYISWCRFPEVHYALLILPSIGQQWCHLMDLHRSQLMRVCIGWNFLPLANVSCTKSRCFSLHCLKMDDANLSQPIQTRYKWHVQELVDHAFQCQTLLSKCAYAKKYLCMPWLMLVALSTEALAYGSFHWLTLISPRWCTNATGYVLMPWKMLHVVVTSLPKSVKTKLVEWRPSLILPITVKNILVDAWCFTTMSPNRCIHATDDVCKTLLMLPAIDWCHLTDACRSWTMSLSRYSHAIGDAYIPWLLLLFVTWCRFVDVCRPQLMSSCRCAHTIVKVTSWGGHDMMMHGGLSWCCMSLANITSHMRTCHIREWIPWLILYATSQFCFQDTDTPYCAYRSWLKLHVIGQRLLEVAHTSCKMHLVLGWCTLLFADISRPMSARYKWCWQSISDVIIPTYDI